MNEPARHDGATVPRDKGESVQANESPARRFSFGPPPPLIALVCLLAAGCMESPARSPNEPAATGTDLPRVCSVEVSPGALTLEKGERTELSVEVKTEDSSVPDESASWAVGDPSVVTLRGTGSRRQVEGLEVGRTVVVASVSEVADTATVDVTAPGAGAQGPAVVFDPDLEVTTTSLRNDSQGVFSENQDLGSSRFFLDTSEGYSGGSRSMRYDWVDQGAGNAVSIGRKIPLPSNAREVWVEAYVRWSKNFMDNIQLDSNDGDPSTDVAAHKFLFLAATCVTSCNAGWEISDGTKVYRWALLWPAATRNPPHGPISAETPAIVEQNVATDGPQIIKGISHDVSQHFDDRWHWMRVHIRHDPGAYEVWIDGQKVVDLVQEGFNFTIRPEVATTAVLLGRNKDDGNPSGTESLWWGKVSVWTSDPGW